MRQYDVQAVGATDEGRERCYAISAGRKRRYPPVAAVTEAAWHELFPAQRASR